MPPSLYARVRETIESARRSAARSVNTAQVISNWLIGREIVQDEQRGAKRVAYGEELLEALAKRLSAEFGAGYSFRNLHYFRQFFLGYPHLLSGAPSTQFGHAARAKSHVSILNALRAESWRPGRLSPGLAWTHYRILVRVSRKGARAFYEIEAVRNSWSGRELERQIDSLLYERLAKSRDKAGLMRLANEGHEINRPEDVFKDPFVIEFLGLPESSKLVESKLEEALLENLQRFLLELGKGFAFVARQERLSLDGDNFYVDLVFYHAVLKCYVLIDLKAGKLTHQDLGQMQFYINYFDRHRRTEGDAPTLGLLLCTDKNDAVVRYTLGEEQRKIFASRYRLYLPSESELASQLKRGLQTFHDRANPRFDRRT